MSKKIIIILFTILSISIFADSPISGQFEARFGWFMPNIDSEPALVSKGETPYKDIFIDSGFQFGFEIGSNIFSHELAGTLMYAFGLEYFKKEGYALKQDGTRSKDQTTLKMLPLKLSLTYNIDQFETLFNVPLVPYIKAGFQYKIWYIEDSIGDTAINSKGNKASGGKYGTFWAVGLRFLLDFMDQDSALSFDNDLGINDSYIFIEYLSSDIDSFGKPGMQLGGAGWFFGLALTY